MRGNKNVFVFKHFLPRAAHLLWMGGNQRVIVEMLYLLIINFLLRGDQSDVEKQNIKTININIIFNNDFCNDGKCYFWFYCN